MHYFSGQFATALKNSSGSYTCFLMILEADYSVFTMFCRVQLLRVPETRKTVLRKEQAMAFARAVAAGFDIDNLIYLISFAENFGASCLM